MAARFGGEELVMVLADMDLGEGIWIAERIRRAVEAVAIPHEASRRGIVTVSIGVTAGIPSPELAQHDFLAAADAALYAAKRNGRNQVWPPLRAAEAYDLVTVRRPADGEGGLKAADCPPPAGGLHRHPWQQT